MTIGPDDRPSETDRATDTRGVEATDTRRRQARRLSDAVSERLEDDVAVRARRLFDLVAEALPESSKPPIPAPAGQPGDAL